MFCSNCGKTLKGDLSVCPHCKNPVGESRFEGLPYTGAQVKTKPGEAVRLPANHTKTTYMGTDPALSSDVDARTTYRATNEQVYAYEEAEPIYDEDFSKPARKTAYAPEMENEEEIYDVQSASDGKEEEPVDEAAFEGGSGSDKAFEKDEPLTDAAENIDGVSFDDEEDPVPTRRERKAKKAKAQKIEQDEDQALIDSLNEEELEELKETLSPTKKKVKKARKKTEEELWDEEMLEEIRARDVDVEDDDEEIRLNMEKYAQSGRYDRAPQAQTTVDKAPKAPKEKKNKFTLPHMPKLSFLKKREENFEIEDVEEAYETPYEEIDDENAFNLNDLPEMDETPIDDQEYVDDEISDEELAGMELSDDEIEFDERRKPLSPKAIAIIKYACASILVVAVLVGVIMGLRYITDKTRKAPIEGVTYDLYMSGIELMQYRASDAYRNDVMSAYDGMATSMMAITARITDDLDAIGKMTPENPDVNDARYIDALKTIQNSINNSILNDILSVSSADKTAEEKEADSAQRWQSVRDMVTTLSGATSNAQLDAIIKGERIEVIQQATPEPEATATPVPYTTLANGSEGMAVTRLQQRLADLGYLNSEIDGDFGKKTKTAVQLFQQTAGLEVTGIADPETQKLLFSADAPSKGN